MTRREDYAAFRRAVAADEAQEISLDNKSPGTAAGGSRRIGGANCMSPRVQALKNNNYELAVESVAARGEVGTRSTRSAWDKLGRAYLALGKNEQAIEAFKKQIEINAYDEYAYNGSGRGVSAAVEVRRGDSAIPEADRDQSAGPEWRTPIWACSMLRRRSLPRRFRSWRKL